MGVSKIYKKIILILIFICINLNVIAIEFSGKVFNQFNKQPIKLANVLILETKQKVRTNELGVFNIDIKKQNTYTVLVRALGYKSQKLTLNINKPTQKDFFLEVTLIKGNKLTIKVKKDKQSLGRNTLKVEDLKKIPATFGDALGAATILPGVIRANGFLGSLILRGVGNLGNRYFIDGIPIINPQHFAGIQFIISNDIINTFDIYASSAPVDFGQIYGGTISVDTIDNVKSFKGVVDISLLYASFYFQGLLEKKHIDKKGKIQKKTWGYWISSIRIGYLGWTVLPIVRAATKNNNIPLPQYVDYQFKFKFFLDNKSIHSLSLLLFGTYDYLNIEQQKQQEDIVKALVEDGANPFLIGENDIENQSTSNIQALYYTFKPSNKFQEKLYLYNVVNYNINKLFSPIIQAQLGSDGTDLTNTPNIFSLNHAITWNFFKSIAFLKWNFGYDLYYFKTNGKILQPTGPINTQGGPPTPAEFATFQSTDIVINTQNHLFYTFVKFEFTYLGFFSNIGTRIDYLLRNNQVTFSPRGLIGYEFSTETSISTAAGIYNSFPQINFFYFNQPFSSNPQIVENTNIKSEISYQFSLGLDQKFLKYYSIKLEGFYNILDNLIESNPNFSNSASGRNYGLEVLLKKDAQKEKKVDFYSWFSYTYTKAERKNSQSNNQFIPFEQAQDHTFKATTGIQYKQNPIVSHEFGLRFELSTGRPYTPIIGSTPDSITLFGTSYDYYNPVYGEQNSKNFPIQHRLDFRYTFTKQYKKFKFSFYIELINVYYLQPNNTQTWKYNQVFSSGNPTFNNNISIPIIPSFGFEFIF